MTYIRLVWLAVRAFFLTAGSWITLLANASLALKGIRVGLYLAGVVAVLVLVPLPEWLSGLPGKISSLPAQFWWFLNIVQGRFAVSVIFGAFITRWILRRVFEAMRS